MGTAATILVTAAGIALMGVALRDVFDVLFHETGKATVSHGVTRAVWWVFGRLAGVSQEAFALAGPFALLAVVASWALLLIAGWTLVFWPHMPGSFHFASGVPAGHDLVDALYLSMVTLATVGFGDITPAGSVLRVVTPLEALLGFGLLTASISWLLSIYPVLSRRRSLAYEINLLTHSEQEIGAAVLDLDEGAAEAVYSELTSRLVAVERDMATFPVAYYFAERDERFSLPARMSALLELAERGTAEDAPARVRLRATMLHEAIDDFARTAQGFHGISGDSTAEMLKGYARDHRR